MQRFNFNDATLEPGDREPPGYRVAEARIGEAIGASMLAGRLYVLPPGESVCPYHWEYGDEEWLMVLTGAPVVRHPEGEDTLAPGDVVCFPAGPAGAHRVSAGQAEARVIMLSTRRMPAVCVYPDSDKVGVFDDVHGDTRLLFGRASAVDYYEGER